jgi:hypothetical protein
VTREKIFLTLVASLFAGFGVAYFLYPLEMAALSGMQLPVIPSRIDVWAIYAGVQIGLGAYLFRSVWSNFAIDASLLMVAYLVGGIALLRTIGVFYYASFDTYSLGALVFEGPAAITAWMLFLRYNKT